MNILIPMAGEGSRFAQEGYQVSKPLIPTTSLKLRKKVPMVAAAVLDLPDWDSSQILFIDRDFHQRDGSELRLLEFFPKAQFITLNQLTSGQATTCLQAKSFIDNDQELLIAGCDNGMVIDEERFQDLKSQSDCIVFTHQRHELVLRNPEAYGWVAENGSDDVLKVSVKKTISQNPLEDHAIVATFWFRRGKDFVSAAEKMISANDRVNNEFYVDQVINYVVQANLKVKVFPVTRYLCWGTPIDYENYEATLLYWKDFLKIEEGKSK